MKRPRIKLEFTVYGEGIDPEEFSKVSQLKYTSSFMNRKKKVNDRVVEWQESVWEYATEYISTFDIEDVVLGVTERLKKRENEIEEYIKKITLSVDLVLL